MSSTDLESITRRLALVEARAEIESAIRRYGHAGDRRDVKSFVSVFHPDSTHNHSGVYVGNSVEFAQMGLQVIAQTECSVHYLTNIEVKVDFADGTAVAESYFAAYHHLSADAPEGAFGGHRVGVAEVKWVGGRYFDRFELRDGEWKIIHRTCVHDWEHWHPADARGFVRSLVDVPTSGPYSEG